MSTSVVLLAYKEAENLKILLPQIHKVMEKLKDDYEVIVIDSAKPLDNTKEVCEKNNTLYYPQEDLFIDQKLTAIRIVYTGDHVHQRRFAAAVFAQQGENFSSADG